MPKNQFSSENQPQRKGRKKAFKTKLMEVIRDSCILEGADSVEKAEKKFIEHAAIRAIHNEDASLLKELINKSYPQLKAALPEYSFDLPENASPAQKASAVLSAIAKGEIPADVGAMLIQATKGLVDIELGTELKDRIARLEQELGIDV